MCLRAIKTKHYSCRAYLSSVSWAITLTFTLNRLSGFQTLRRKGGKFDHHPERPKVLLRHCSPYVSIYRRSLNRDQDIRWPHQCCPVMSYFEYITEGTDGETDRHQSYSLRLDAYC